MSSHFTKVKNKNTNKNGLTHREKRDAEKEKERKKEEKKEKAKRERDERYDKRIAQQTQREIEAVQQTQREIEATGPTEQAEAEIAAARENPSIKEETDRNARHAEEAQVNRMTDKQFTDHMYVTYLNIFNIGDYREYLASLEELLGGSRIRVLRFIRRIHKYLTKHSMCSLIILAHGGAECSVNREDSKTNVLNESFDGNSGHDLNLIPMNAIILHSVTDGLYNISIKSPDEARSPFSRIGKLDEMLQLMKNSTSVGYFINKFNNKYKIGQARMVMLCSKNEQFYRANPHRATVENTGTLKVRTLTDMWIELHKLNPHWYDREGNPHSDKIEFSGLILCVITLLMRDGYLTFTTGNSPFSIQGTIPPLPEGVKDYSYIDLSLFQDLLFIRNMRSGEYDFLLILILPLFNLMSERNRIKFCACSYDMNDPTPPNEVTMQYLVDNYSEIHKYKIYYINTDAIIVLISTLLLISNGKVADLTEIRRLTDVAMAAASAQDKSTTLTALYVYINEQIVYHGYYMELISHVCRQECDTGLRRHTSFYSGVFPPPDDRMIRREERNGSVAPAVDGASMINGDIPDGGNSKRRRNRRNKRTKRTKRRNKRTKRRNRRTKRKTKKSHR